MKLPFRPILLLAAFCMLLSSCVVSGPGYYRTRYRPMIVRPYYPHPLYWGGHHYHHSWRHRRW